MTVDELLLSCPVSEQGRRVLMERLDAAAVVYRLATAVSNAAYPMRFRWYRAMPMDAAMTLPDGRTVAVVRQGLTADRTAFSKRLWRLREKFRPSAVLMLMPDEVRLRHARRLMAGAPSIAFLALESEAASAGASAPIWRPPAGPALLDLRTALSYARRRGAWPVEKSPSKVFLPGKITLEGPEREVADWMLPSLLKPAEKRAVDLLSDWPWIAPAHLGELLGVKRSMLSRILVRLEGLGLAVDLHVEGDRRLILADRGLAMLARRDRSSVGAARKRWSVTPMDAKAPLDWRNVTGRRSRQLLRNVEHTDAVHWFVAVLERQAHSRSGRPVRPAPTRLKVLQARRPAALLLIASAHRRSRRAALVLVVFEDEVAQTHFLRVARDGDGANRGHRAPVRLPQESAGEGGAAGTGLAGNGRLGTRLRS